MEYNLECCPDLLDQDAVACVTALSRNTCIQIISRYETCGPLHTFVREVEFEDTDTATIVRDMYKYVNMTLHSLDAVSRISQTIGPNLNTTTLQMLAKVSTRSLRVAACAVMARLSRFQWPSKLEFGPSQSKYPVKSKLGVFTTASVQKNEVLTIIPNDHVGFECMGQTAMFKHTSLDMNDYFQLNHFYYVEPDGTEVDCTINWSLAHQNGHANQKATPVVRLSNGETICVPLKQIRISNGARVFSNRDKKCTNLNYAGHCIQTAQSDDLANVRVHEIAHGTMLIVVAKRDMPPGQELLGYWRSLSVSHKEHRRHNRRCAKKKSRNPPPPPPKSTLTPKQKPKPTPKPKPTKTHDSAGGGTTRPSDLGRLIELQALAPLRAAFTKWHKMSMAQSHREHEHQRVLNQRNARKKKLESQALSPMMSKAEHVAPKAYRLTCPIYGYSRKDACSDPRHAAPLTQSLLNEVGVVVEGDLFDLITTPSSSANTPFVVNLRAGRFTKKQTAQAAQTIYNGLVCNASLKARLEKASACQQKRAVFIDIVCGGGGGNISSALTASSLRRYLTAI